MIFDISRDILNVRRGRAPTKERDDSKSKCSRDLVASIEVENSFPTRKRSSKRSRGYSFLQLDSSPPSYEEAHPAPEYDSHNQPIPPSLQLKRHSSSQRYSSRQNQLVQDLSVQLIAIVLPKQFPPPRPEPRKILNEDIRVRKLRGDKYNLSYCLPKTQVTPRPPSPLRKELARAS